MLSAPARLSGAALACAVALLLTTGCERPAPGSPAASGTPPTRAPGAGSALRDLPPEGTAPGEAAAARMDVDKLKASADRLEAAARAKPTDLGAKMKAADADYEAGVALMMSPKLDRKVKYRAALQYYRRALVLNPHHKGARQNSDLIIGIYRQMGRPVPK